MPSFAVAGVLEGFYGPPWSWDDRVAIMERCAPAGLPWYVWAPKSDPLHRKRWREPFSKEHLDGFRRLAATAGVRVGVAISPGADLGDLDAGAEALAEKLRPALEVGIGLVMIAFDDIDPTLTDGERHAALVCALTEQLSLDGVHLVVVPTHYATTEPTKYLRSLSSGLPPDVMMGWTGRHVVNDAITIPEAASFADAVDGRPLALWDNYPVNDAFLADRAFLLPLAGRDPRLDEYCGVYLANAAVQPWLGLPALLSAGAWATTGVATAPWEVEGFDEPVGIATLAQACDGRELFRLAEAAIAAAGDDPDDKVLVAADDLWWWLERIEHLDVSGLIGEAARPWMEQARAEASVSLNALELLERDPDEADVAIAVMSLAAAWTKVRRGTVSALGTRFALTPRASLDDKGSWTLSADALTEDRNATDILCRAALARHAKN
jgi:hyaluronoglucosaminidase